jgi:molybdenum cofactor cytidylyltransferase
VLAAGGSTRLRTPKQLLAYQGRTLLRRAAETALEAVASTANGAVAGAPALREDRAAPAARARVIVVLGSEAARMRAELAGLDVRVVENSRWAEGLNTSLRAGLDALDPASAADAAVDAALFTTCDQPDVTPDLLRKVIAAYAASRPPIVACEYAGTVGVPALFDRALFAELRELRGDAGAKRVIERHRESVARIPFSEVAFDIDTAADILRLL